MKLAQIIRLALRQLDEDVEDVAEYEELFVNYANQGNLIAMNDYYKPRETVSVQTDAEGKVYILGMGISRVVSVLNAWGANAQFDISEDGMQLKTYMPLMEITITYEPEVRELAMGDEPMLPTHAHPALADYICYRHLSSGNLAKQSRAEFFRNAFYQQLRSLKPQGAGSVARMKNLYEMTDIRR